MRSDILAVVPYFFPRIGGGETHLYQLADLLSRKGHGIAILTQLLPGTREFEEKGRVSLRRFGDALTQAGRHRAYTQILEYVRRNAFPRTVLYEYLSVGADYCTALMCEILAAARQKGLRTVVRIPSSKRVTELAELYPAGVEELLLADSVIALNPGIYNELVSYGVEPGRISTISNGVDVHRFFPLPASERRAARSAVGPAGDGIIFFCPTRFAPKKRIPELLRVWEDITRTYAGDRPPSLWLVGDDHYEARRGLVSGQVEVITRELELQGVSIFPGVPHDRIHRYFQAADVYISLSEQEGMSNAMLEAMASGLPVLAPDTPAVSHLIADGVNGYLFTPGDLHSARQAVMRCLNVSDQERAEMGRRNRELICSGYRVETMADNFSALFDSLAFGPAPPH